MARRLHSLQTPLLDAYRRMPQEVRFLDLKTTQQSVHAHPIIIICGVVEILQTGLLSPYGEVPGECGGRPLIRVSVGGVTRAS
jgi:hypothetical protein